MISPNLTTVLAMICLVIAAFFAVWLTATVKTKPFNPCHPGYRVTVNGEYVGCTNDQKSPYNVWIPTERNN